MVHNRSNEKELIQHRKSLCFNLTSKLETLLTKQLTHDEEKQILILNLTGHNKIPTDVYSTKSEKFKNDKK